MLKFTINVCLHFCLVAGLCGMWACQESKEDERQSQKNTEADTSFTAKIETLNKKLAQTAKDPLLFYERSKLYFENKDSARAFADINQAIKLAPDNPSLYNVKALYFYVRQSDDSASFYYREAARLGTIDAVTFFNLGNLATLKGKYDEALKWYRKAINFRSDAPDYYFAIGFARQKSKDYVGAEEEYKKAIRLDTNYVKSYSALFDMYFNELNDPTGALFFNNKILQKDSLHPAGRLNLSYYYYKEYKKSNKPELGKKYITLALENATRALKKNARFADAYYQRGYLFFELRQYNKAIDDFENVVRLNPKNAKAYFMLGAIYEAFDSYAEAREFYQKCLTLDPTLKEAQTALKVIANK